MVQEGDATDSILGTNVLETRPYNPTFNINSLEQFQDRLWHPVYFQTTGTCVEIFISFDIDQILNPNIAWDDFEIEAMILYTSPSSMRLQ